VTDYRGSEYTNDRAGQSLPPVVREVGEAVDAALKTTLLAVRERDQVRLVSAHSADILNGNLYLTFVAVVGPKDDSLRPWSPDAMARAADKLICELTGESARG
jgi:hypothetical protein